MTEEQMNYTPPVLTDKNKKELSRLNSKDREMVLRLYQSKYNSMTIDEAIAQVIGSYTIF